MHSQLRKLVQEYIFMSEEESISTIKRKVEESIFTIEEESKVEESIFTIEENSKFEQSILTISSKFEEFIWTCLK